MQILPIHTGHLHSGDSLVDALLNAASLETDDILCISSKALATTEGCIVNLATVVVSEKARAWANLHNRDAAFRQAILNETQRMNGRILHDESRAVLTELAPAGFPEGTILVASAGLDRSNIGEGFAVGWPEKPLESMHRIRLELEEKSSCRLSILITDSCLRPRRLGVIAQALVVSGFDPIVSQIDSLDLFGNPLKITYEAVADQLATAANMVMGNAGQAIPAVVIRDHGISQSNFEGWVPGIKREEDLFHGLL